MVGGAVMRCPTVATLTAAFRDLTPDRARLIRQLAHSVDDRDAIRALIKRECPSTHAYACRCYNDPYDSGMWRRTMALHAIDAALGTYGVEPLGEVSMRHGPPYEYCNAGDTYATTLVYDRDRDRLIVTSYGDIVESDPRFRDAGGDE